MTRMAACRFVGAAAVMAAAAVIPRAAAIQLQSSGDLVELDVAVVDRDGRRVAGLKPSDFQVKDDGQRVDVKTFEAVDADDERPRTIVLLLDDSGVPMAGTSVVQAIALHIFARARLRDEVTVVRLNNDRDEPYGDPDTARQRIADYHAGAVPFQMPATLNRALRVLALISRDLEPLDHRRKLVVCIGSPAVCNMAEPQPRGYSALWRPWVDAIGAASRANVSVYAAMPTAPGAVRFLGGGLSEITGGTGFSNTGNFDAFVDGMWEEASHYYLLGYWPPERSGSHPLHSVDVKVNRKDVHVHARRQR
jgi:VWFA-related protein